MAYKQNTMNLWKDAPECDCGEANCNPKNHRKCPICGEMMLYGSHYSVVDLRKSPYAWNVDYIIQKADGGNNKYSNLRAVHIRCNKSRNREDHSGEY